MERSNAEPSFDLGPCRHRLPVHFPKKFLLSIGYVPRYLVSPLDISHARNVEIKKFTMMAQMQNDDLNQRHLDFWGIYEPILLHLKSTPILEVFNASC